MARRLEKRKVSSWIRGAKFLDVLSIKGQFGIRRGLGKGEGRSPSSDFMVDAKGHHFVHRRLELSRSKQRDGLTGAGKEFGLMDDLVHGLGIQP